MSLSIDQLHPYVLNAGLAVHDADWNRKDVVSPFSRLYYVVEGTAQIKLPSGIHTLKPNHMYFIPAFTRHSNICDSHFCHYYMHIYEENQEGKSILDEWDFPIEVPGSELDLVLIKRFCRIYPHMNLQESDPTTYDNDVTLIHSLLLSKQRAFYDKVEARGIVYQLLARFMRLAREKSLDRDERLVKVLSYIHKHINRKKIEHAQLTLVTSETQVKDVALNLGFEDYSYFNRLFKKLVGTTPQEYRHSNHKI
ncbi:transcriptional regulator [Bacteroides sp. CAG:462]|nr:transcriptional regulator [Bacteroides sp. CAG:462]